MGLIEKLNSSDFFHQKWTHCMVTLYSNSEFKFNFSYIPEEDSWGNLYLRGISDLKEEELDEYYIPKEIWLDRVARKAEIYKIKE
ncbi:hypothetical protein A1D23_01135 [Chelonobacter oris]|uniref:hypothetical protein n=1 Tax=Chelonobacter oris TaxID=505317 RepID=UPI00244A082B|nr:hypothetical protein [Chelonobacter oris]MDH3000465.1 hypothetical protein [Chelonobacter oris]